MERDKGERGVRTGFPVTQLVSILPYLRYLGTSTCGMDGVVVLLVWIGKVLR